MEGSTAPYHPPPAFARDNRGVRLSKDFATQFECRVAAQDEAVDRFTVDQLPDDGLSLGARKLIDSFGCRQRMPALSRERGDNGVFVDSRADQPGRFDTRRTQGREPGGGGGCEVEAHGNSYARRMGEMQGKQVEVDVTNVAHGGIGVARHEGRVIFVSDAIPGERVVAHISDDSKKSFWRAETVSVVTPSEHRRPHVWAAASVDRAPENRAGGAEFGHIEIAHQRELKRQVLADALKRMAGIDSDVVVDAIDGAEDGTGWRTRLRLHVAEDGTLGPYAARSHRVIQVPDVPLATPEVAAIAPLDETFSGSTHVDVISPSSGNAFVLAGDNTAKSRPKNHAITEVVGDRQFRLDVRGFWQVHRHAAAALTSAVQDAIDPELFDPRAANQDLYGGVGLLAAAVGDRFGNHTRITTVESDALATDHAAENLAEWMGAAAVTSRVDRYLHQLAKTRSDLTGATVVLDPPRAGAGKDVVDSLARFAPAQIVYVACDPVALARDVALFQERGYQLQRLRAFDLFPNTHHVEAVASLVRTQEG